MKNRPILIDAIRALKEDASVSTRGDEIIWNDGNPTNITREQINTKLEEIQSEYDLSLPLGLLREERNKKLAETDWWASSDLLISDDQRKYRQALRDITKTAEPKLDENYNLINIDWPEKPWVCLEQIK